MRKKTRRRRALLRELLEAGEAYTTEEMAALLGVSVWTIRRDLLMLQTEPPRLPLICRTRVRREWLVYREKQ